MPFDDRDFPDLPRGERAATPRAKRLVGLWLYCIAAMILVMTGLGGATRLSGSGLSIMEWAPIMGTFPPLSGGEWERLFALYRKIPQYSLINEGFGLEGFKRIFWLEWSHRLWGRLIGLVFVVPLLWFAATRRLELRLVPRLVLFLFLGGLQGAAGWFMVASGFFPDATAVAPVRLVVHLGLALLLYGAVLWTALSLAPPGPRVMDASVLLRGWSWLTLGLTAATLVAGGFVAGLHAGLTYNTFPLMDGRWLPEGYADLDPFIRNLTGNVAAVQFNHRLLATLTLIAATILSIAAWPRRAVLGWRALAPVGFVLAQYILGVLTLVLVSPPGLALAHQVCAMLLLTAVLTLTHAVRPFQIPGHGQMPRRAPFHRSVTSSAAEDPKA